ncbi:MAG: hypothetical protein HYU69_10795 [Bacteroidetes bacterium]|nr:hypothetical protein [Bacteroidota bacterium]
MKKVEVLIIADAGIGNAIQALYAVEYCLYNKVNVCIYLNKVNKSFQNYLTDCYSNAVILLSLENISTKYLIHSFTYQEKIHTSFEHYFYVFPDSHSSQNLSETEQYLSIVKALFPSTYHSTVLTSLKEQYSSTVKGLSIETKYILYPGGSAVHSARRWPYYIELMNLFGKNNVIVVGSKDDINYNYSFVYPWFISRLLPQQFLNSKSLWKFLKKIHILKPHAHINSIDTYSNVYIEKFSWPELSSLFKRCKKFIGNDGGLTHLAASVGAKGTVLFGPTSVQKNKPYNINIKPIYNAYPCQPCQFGTGKVQLVNYYINCPYEVKCMKNIYPTQIIDSLND